MCLAQGSDVPTDQPTSVSAARIAAVTGVSKRAVAKRAQTESWLYEVVAGVGGMRRLYQVARLPDDVRSALGAAEGAGLIEAPPVTAGVRTGNGAAGDGGVAAGMASSEADLARPGRPGRASFLPAPQVTAAELTRRQLDVERARERLLDWIAAYPGGAARAIDALNADRERGALEAPVAWAMSHAWDKPRADARLTLRTYHNWRALRAQRGRAAPAQRERVAAVPAWYGLLLELRQRPQGSTLRWVAEQIAAQWRPEWGAQPPSYHTVRRACAAKISQIDQLRGRLTGSALRAHQHYRPRTADGMVPWQEVHADGWNTHFTAPHPVTGEYVTYEIWHYHDVATRYVPPPGVGMTETYEVVTAGLERCVRAGGIPAVLMTDSTSVVKRSPRFTTDPWAALAERAGITVVHPVSVGNSQANGIAESFNRYLDARCREIATYQAAGMDSGTLKKVRRLTAQAVRAATGGDVAERDRALQAAGMTGRGIVFRSYVEAVQWVEHVVSEFNARPHSSLPKVRDAQTGRQRHQTPAEALAQHRAAGWAPVMPSDEHIVDLFRPHVRCRVRREAVTPVGNRQRYHAPGLGAWNGQEVMVAVDPQDPAAVWVKTLQGQVICIAALVSASGYRAQSTYEMAQAKRAAAQLRRLQTKAQAVRARHAREIPAAAAEQVVLGGRVVAAAEALQPVPRAPARRAVEVESQARPRSRSERSPGENYSEWLELDARVGRGETLPPDLERWYRSYPTSAQYRAEAKKRAAA